MNPIRVLFTTSIFAICASIANAANPVMIRLVDPLDEPEFYCIDVPGFRQNVQLDAPLMAHTLKRFGSADEMFAIDHPSSGQISAIEYGLCIQAESAQAGAKLLLKPPSDSPLQRFTFTDSGAIVLEQNPDLCIAIAPGSGQKAGGPSHLRRDLGIVSLKSSDLKLHTWKLVRSAQSWPE